MLRLQIVLWSSFTGNVQSPSCLCMGYKAKHRKQSPYPQCLSLPWKPLVQPQGKLFPAVQTLPVLAMHRTMQLLPPSPSQPFCSVFSVAPVVRPPVSLPQLPLCFCHLGRRATLWFPQDPNEGASAQPRAWQTALYFYCRLFQTSAWVNMEAHLTHRQANTYFHFQFVFQVSSTHWHFCRIRRMRAWF